MNKLATVLIACVLGLASCGSSDDASSSVTAAENDNASSESDSGAENDETTDDEAAMDDESAMEDESHDEPSEDASADEQALIDAMDEASSESAGEIFSAEEIHCTNAAIVTGFGVDTMAGYGITVDNPDDSLLPEEYDVQEKAVTAITDCVDLAAAFGSLAGDCDLGAVGNDEMATAMRYDFLSGFAEYDDPDGEAASLAVDAAIEACDAAS